MMKLVIVGHSLGAGIATLLSIILKKQYPLIKCYSYGTPGSVVDRQTSQEISSYVTSIVLDSDIICRISFHSIIQLKIAIIESILLSCVNKITVLQSIFHNINSNNINELMNINSNDNNNNEFKQNLIQYIVSYIIHFIQFYTFSTISFNYLYIFIKYHTFH